VFGSPDEKCVALLRSAIAGILLIKSGRFQRRKK
jgi:hypothetical protein